MYENPYMMFEIKEKVKHFKNGQSFWELSSLELEPIVKVLNSKEQVEVAGYLVLNGEFLKGSNHWEEDSLEQSDGIHYSSYFGNDEMETFQYQIPISFEIHPDRISEIGEVFLLVEHFDYEVLSESEMNIVAHLKLQGVHPDPKQDTVADLDETYGDVSETSKTLYNEELEEENVHVEPNTPSDLEQNREESVAIEKEEEYEMKTDRYNEKEEEKAVEKAIPFEAKQEHDAVEKASEEKTDVEETSAKMKIGIKGKNRDKQNNEDHKSSPSSLIYSLLRKDKSAKEHEIKDKELELEEGMQQEEIEKSDDNTVVNMNEYIQTKEQELQDNEEIEYNQEVGEVEEEHVEEKREDEVSSAKTNIDSNTKDMLFSLLQGDEEKKYRLKIYFVKKEDNLELIAEKYGLKVTDIITYNRLEKDDLEEGQLLYLPSKK